MPRYSSLVAAWHTTRGEEGEVGRWLIVEKMMAWSHMNLAQSENRAATASSLIHDFFYIIRVFFEIYSFLDSSDPNMLPYTIISVIFKEKQCDFQKINQLKKSVI